MKYIILFFYLWGFSMTNGQSGHSFDFFAGQKARLPCILADTGSKQFWNAIMAFMTCKMGLQASRSVWSAVRQRVVHAPVGQSEWPGMKTNNRALIAIELANGRIDAKTCPFKNRYFSFHRCAGAATTATSWCWKNITWFITKNIPGSHFV